MNLTKKQRFEFIPKITEKIIEMGKTNGFFFIEEYIKDKDSIEDLLYTDDDFGNSYHIHFSYENILNLIKNLDNTIMYDMYQYLFPEEAKKEFLEYKADLNIYKENKIMNTKIPDFWDKNCLRVFISHSVKNYDIAKKLKDHLKRYNLSCFVAHKDIEPAKQWQQEIKKALNSMEIMFCLITENSCKSLWVNQEIGFALARNIPIIPIKLGNYDPKGFISEIQAMSLDVKKLESNTSDIIRLITKEFSQYSSVKKHFLNQFLKAKGSDFNWARQVLMNIIHFKFNDQEIEEIVTAIKDPENNNQLTVLLSFSSKYDRISEEHLKQLQNNKCRYYAELLNDKILSQHTQNRYSIQKINGESHFEIIDSQTLIAKKQKTNKKQKYDDLPF